MFTFALPAVPLLSRIGTHAVAGAAGALVYAHRAHLTRWRQRNGEHRVHAPRSLRPEGTSPGAQAHADERALHAQLRQTLASLDAQVREVHSLLQHLSARQDALELLLTAHAEAPTPANEPDGDGHRTRSRAAEARVTP